MSLTQVLEALDPLEHRAVDLVYFEGRTFAQAALVLEVEQAEVGRAVAAAYRPIARYVREEGQEPEVARTAVTTRFDS